MKNLSIYTAAKAVILFAFVLVLTNSSFGQSETKKDSVVGAAGTQTVNSQQSVSLDVRLDTPASGSGSGQVTLSGYLEDLPPAS